MPKRYLADGVYYECSPAYGVTLTTEDGIRVQNTIHLDSDVLSALLQALAQDFDPEKLKAAINRGARS